MQRAFGATPRGRLKVRRAGATHPTDGPWASAAAFKWACVEERTSPIPRSAQRAAWLQDRLSTLGIPWRGEAERPSEVIVGCDGSDPSRYAAAWAAALGCRVHLVHGSSLYEPPASLVQDARTGLAPEIASGWADQAREDAAASFHHVRDVVKGIETREHVSLAPPPRAILRVVDEVHAGLIAVGHAGKGAATRLLLGSVSEAVAHRAGTSTLVARGGPGPGPVVAALAPDPSSAAAVSWAAGVAAWLHKPLILAQSAPEGVLLSRFHFPGPDADARVVAWPPARALRSRPHEA